jgi:hypothetical protein
VLRNHGRVDATPHVEFRRDAQEARLAGVDQIGEDLVGDGLVKSAPVAVRPQVELEGLEFDAGDVGHILDVDGGKVRLAGLGAEASKFRHPHTDGIVTGYTGVGEGFQRPARFG